MSSIRVKLIFERQLVKSPEQCWMLIDRSSCKMINDLEYLIAKKFFVAGHTVLNLFLDDFLLPSKEKIDVIRDNDVLRVVEDTNHILSNKNSEKTSSKEKIRSSKKRKYEESSDSKRKIKKAKHSFDKNLIVENNIDTNITDKQLNANHAATNDSKITQNSVVHNINKEKTKENVHKISNKNSTPKGNSIAETKTKQKKLKKRHKKPSKDKSIATKLNSFWNKLAGSQQQKNPTLSTTKSNEPHGSTQTDKAMDNGVNLGGSAEKQGVQEKGVNGKLHENNGDSLNNLLSKGKDNNETPNRIQNGFSKTSQGNHIRFDNEEDVHSTADVLNNAMLPLTHPRVLSIRGANTPCPNGTPNLSPIEPNAQNGFPDITSTNGTNKVNNYRGGRGGKRRDCYTNRSQIMESTRVEKDTQSQESQSVTVEAPEKDFSVYPLLHGPPRIGDVVAYKMIELSQSYTPEISKYKEGKVLSFDSQSKQLTLKLTKESLQRVKGDGHVSSKFEIFENNEDDDQVIATQEPSDEVEVQWTSMIEPRLVVV